MKKHWYVIAHKAGVRIFEQDGIAPQLTMVHHYANQGGKLAAVDGLAKTKADSQIAAETGLRGEDGSWEHLLANFLKDLSEFLDKEAGKNSFASLTLVADAHVLGSLKKELGKPSSLRLRETLSKDLVHISDREMLAHLKNVMMQAAEIDPPVAVTP